MRPMRDIFDLLVELGVVKYDERTAGVNYEVFVGDDQLIL